MSVSQDKRSEETKKRIVIAAQKLFANLGYDGVTMRQLAKEAGCSHTTIYIYFKDKEELLHHLAMPLLLELNHKIKTILQLEMLTQENKLKEMSRAFIRFSLENKNMYNLLIVANSTRVDLKETELQINKVRLELFKHMRDAIQACCVTDDTDQLLGYSRVFFYMLHGIITTYLSSKDSYSQLIERLGQTFDTAVDILLLGFNENNNRGGETHED